MSDFNKEKALAAARLIFPQGDSHIASPTKTGRVIVGYVNDYPMQHGNGEQLIIPQHLIDLLVPPPAPLTYTPAQVIEMVRKAFNAGSAWGAAKKDAIDYQQLLTTLGLNQ